MMAKNILLIDPPINQEVLQGTKINLIWAGWFRDVRYYITNISWLTLDFTGSNLTDIATRNHNDLQNIQGGSVGDYYHLTSAQQSGLTSGAATALHTHTHNSLTSIQGGASNDYYHLTNTQQTDLTDGGDSSLHYHSADRDRSNHTGTQTASTISNFSSAAIALMTWSNITFTGSNLTSILTRNHNDLQNIQGGTSSDYYHLTSAQQSGLTGAGNTTLHYHASDRDRANHTGTQTASTISDLSSSTITFTNKSISGSTNTITNVGNSSLTNSSVTIGSTNVSLGGTASTIAGLTLTAPNIGAAAGTSINLTGGGTFGNGAAQVLVNLNYLPSSGGGLLLKDAGTNKSIIGSQGVALGDGSNNLLFYTYSDDINFYAGGAQATIIRANGTLSCKHLSGDLSSAPTISAGAGAGTSPTVSVIGNDTAMQVTVTTGTLPTGAGATVATVTYNQAYSATPHPLWSVANANSALLNGASMISMDGASTTTFTIIAGTTGLTASTTYKWNVYTIG